MAHCSPVKKYAVNDAYDIRTPFIHQDIDIIPFYRRPVVSIKQRPCLLPAKAGAGKDHNPCHVTGRGLKIRLVLVLGFRPIFMRLPLRSLSSVYCSKVGSTALMSGRFTAGCSIGPRDIHDSVTDGISADDSDKQKPVQIIIISKLLRLTIIAINNYCD